MSETLLPGTHALLAATVEFGPYHGGTLVRYSSFEGVAFHELFDDPEAANAQFWKWVRALWIGCRPMRDAARQLNSSGHPGKKFLLEGPQ